MVENNEKPNWEESDRLAALRRYDVLDTPPEPAFDSLAVSAARSSTVPNTPRTSACGTATATRAGSSR